MNEINLEKINRNDWKNRLKYRILHKAEATVRRELTRYGYASIIKYDSDDGTYIMEGYYMCAGQPVSMIRVGLSDCGRAKSFAIYS